MKINNKILLSLAVFISCTVGCIRSANAQISVSEAFYTLARQNNTQKIESLLYKGYSLESVDKNGYTPICLSVVNNDKNAYKTLAAYGANKKPSCLKNVPQSAYRRFFGYAPQTSSTPTYVSDNPYLLGTAVLAAGAVTAAYALRGDTDKDSKSGTGKDDDTGKNNGKGDDNKPNLPTPDNCPANSTYNNLTKQCECNYGFDHFGDASGCYRKIDNCSKQKSDKCSSCMGKYVLKDNRCYAPIPYCSKQDGEICVTCNKGYETHGGNGKTCYKDIANCIGQERDVCKKCESGYGTHGDEHNCYVNIDKCIEGQQVLTSCRACEPGYSTFGDPKADTCYPENENPCAKYGENSNTVPTDKGKKCICNENKGYTGKPGNCMREEEENYREGDGVYDVWNNLNELYCHSHGRYIDLGGGDWTCNCYPGYDNETRDCAVCDTKNGYDSFGSGDGCYRDLVCEKTYGEGFTQQGGACVCKEGYLSFGSQCFKPAECSINQEQVKDAGEPDACVCKANFNAECTACINDNYIYDPESGSCNPKGCPENWSGSKCDVCPAQYKETVDKDGTPHCGLECADNRKPIAENETCEECATGYMMSSLYGTCVINECSKGIEGFKVVDGQCLCDEEKGYIMSTTGLCVKKGEDKIGLSNANVNNGVLTVNNNGEFRDVYGMKPFIKTGSDDEAITYYDEVYNAYSTTNAQNAAINITNQNTGNIQIYGIAAPSVIYNAAASNKQSQEVTATGSIVITDTDSTADIHGIYGQDDNTIYNSFVYASTDDGLEKASNSTANASITIQKQIDGKAELAKSAIGNKITGLEGSGYIFNAYSQTDKGSAANVYSNALIDLTNNTRGETIGIEQSGTGKRVTNAFAFMNSAISDAISKADIKVTGDGDVIGIRSNSTVVNSETQFNKSFNKIGTFSAEGTIDASTNSNIHSVYGIKLENTGDQKSEVYNAMGYNSKGTILVANTQGGSAYGIHSKAATYQDKDADGNILQDEKGDPIVVYNNVYNAFRSSERYGGDNSAALGKIELNLSGASNDNQNVAGIYSLGNVFNAFANSGSDVKLESKGNIIINDNSNTTSIKLHGIDGGGVSIANAYAMGTNKNTDTTVEGNITVNVRGMKSGTTGEAVGIYTDSQITQNAQVYNAALLNDTSKVIGNITVQSPTTTNAIDKMYGIYASSKEIDGQPKTVYNAYYENTADALGGMVRGTITINAPSVTKEKNGFYYGIYVNNGNAYNAYATNKEADVEGLINVDVYGAQENSIAVGMQGQNATLDNSGKSTINVTTHGRKSVAYGMRGESSIINNNAKINVTSDRSDAYGIYLNGGVVINGSDGVITVNGKGNNYGIYAISPDEDTSARVYNQGTINVSGGNNVGIYASGANTKVSNSGKIILGQAGDEGQDIVLKDGATLDNEGTISTSSNLNFDKMGGEVTIGQNGKFEATKSIGGTLNVASNAVMNSFDKTIYIEDALSAEDLSKVNLVSKSYLYNSHLQKNADGKSDIVMKMKEFSDVYDKDVADYYKLNYENSRNQDLFNILKEAGTQKETEISSAEITGKAVLPNITAENLKVQRSLDRTMVSELFKDGEGIRKMVGADSYIGGRDDHGALTGYDLNANSMYALYDKKLDNHYRLGLGMSITHMDTDYNNDSTRKNMLIQGYVPLTYTNGKGLTAVSMARLGYADGQYKRRSLNHTYEANTNEITYGLLNELRYTVNLGGVNFTPFVGLNAIGWYQDSISEGKDSLDINIASSNVFSLESALGLYLDKEVEFNQDSKLNMALGIGYYHEFADPYRGFNARFGGDSLGHYKLRDKHLNSRNRGILTAKVNYDYKDFSIYGELLQYLEKEYPLDIDVGLKYKF